MNWLLLNPMINLSGDIEELRCALVCFCELQFDNHRTLERKIHFAFRAKVYGYEFFTIRQSGFQVAVKRCGKVTPR